MKILIIGGSGTIGKRICAYFSQKNQVITAGRKSGDLQVDIADGKSMEMMFEKLGVVDAVISTAGEAKWADFDALTEADYEIGLRSKLMGQVNLVRIGRKYLRLGGSITLTTGILADDPVAKTTSAALVNGAIHGFVKALVLENIKGLRVNVVSPGLVEDAYGKYKEYFPGYSPIPMKKVVNGYIRSVEGAGNGGIIRIYN